LSPWQTTRFFGFEPFRRILVGNLRETPSEATTTHVCQRVTLQWHVRRFAHRRGILRDETLRSARGLAALRRRVLPPRSEGAGRGLAVGDGAIAQNDYRAANIGAGYVYVISNRGALGERVVKIGLTRRLEPLDRINELGDASVPFRFDVHAIYFSEDAVKLENELHDHFASRRMNWANNRKEFSFCFAVRGALRVGREGGEPARVRRAVRINRVLPERQLLAGRVPATRASLHETASARSKVSEARFWRAPEWFTRKCRTHGADVDIGVSNYGVSVGDLNGDSR
jgi:hypothetical protein